ncbi:hypothetical protein D3C72_1430810 [compost metagenome]
MLKMILTTPLLMMSFSFAQANCGELDSAQLLKETAAVDQLFNAVMNRTPYDEQNENLNKLDRASADLKANDLQTQKTLKCYEENGTVIGYHKESLLKRFADIDMLAILRTQIVVRDNALIGSTREDIMMDAIEVLASSHKTLAQIQKAKLKE